MKSTQLIVLGVAAAAAIGTAFLAFNLANKAPETTVEVQKMATSQVLVAAERVPVGEALTVERLRWQEWPETGVTEEFITQTARPEAIDELSKAIARNSFFAGEPIREEKLVKSDSGYMSAILPSGKRAVGIKVDAISSAGGFILPNDHVDLVLNRTTDNEDRITETLLTNIRVLAVDQLIEEQEDGSKSIVGDTATLELTPEEVELVLQSASGTNATYTLALRSVEDSKDDPRSARKVRTERTTVKIIKFGSTTEVQPKKKTEK